MFKKLLLVAALVAMLLGIGGTAVFAGDSRDGSCPPTYNEDEGVWVQGFCDGRINAFDIAQTAAVYYDTITVATQEKVTDEDGNVSYVDSSTQAISTVEIWVIDSNSVGQLALVVPVDQINAAIATGADAMIAQGNGVALNYSAWGSLWISGPGGYTFNWEPW